MNILFNEQDMNNKIPNEINEGFNEYIKEMHKLRTLIISCEKFLLESIEPTKKGIPYLQISIVSLFLRQAIEILIFSTLVTNKEQYRVEEKALNWRIKDVIKAIEKINPDWFPNPIKIIETEWTAKDLKYFRNKGIQIKPSQKKKNVWEKKENTITKKELIEYYDFLSGFIHYENQLKEERKKWDDREFINKTLLSLSMIRTNIMNLTSTFTIKLTDFEHIYYININKDGVNSNIFGLLKNK